jgi:hypothetical protein
MQATPENEPSISYSSEMSTAFHNLTSLYVAGAANKKLQIIKWDPCIRDASYSLCFPIQIQTETYWRSLKVVQCLLILRARRTSVLKGTQITGRFFIARHVPAHKWNQDDYCMPAWILLKFQRRIIGKNLRQKYLTSAKWKALERLLNFIKILNFLG